MNWLTIRNWLMVRQGEGSTVLHLAVLAMLVGGGLAVGRGSSDALFFKRFGTQYLPHMFFATSFLLVLVSALYAEVADKWRPGKVLLAMSAAFAGLLVANWLLMQFGASPYAFVGYFLIYAVASEILLVHFSFYAGTFFDAQQGKRLTPLVNAASRLGAVIGGLMLGGLVQIWPAPSLALVWVTSLLFIVATVLWKARRTAGIISGPKVRSRQHGNGMLNALFFAKRSKLLRITSLGAFLLIILVSLQDYIVATLLTRHFEREQDLTAFFGLFAAVSNALVLVLQIVVTNRLLHRYGLRAVSMVFPWSTLVTFWLLAWSPGIVTATLARFNYTGMLPAFRMPSANLFYKALPAYMQGRARALILGLVLPSGLAVAGLGLMFVPVEMVETSLPVLGAALAVGFIAIKFRKNVAYSDSLTELIKHQVFAEKSQLVEQDVRMDRRVAQKIAAAIPDSPDNATALAFVDVLCDHAPEDAGPLLLDVAPRASTKVQDHILRCLARLKPEGWQAYARGLLSHEDLHLSSTALEVLGQVKDPASLVGARQWLDHEKPRPKAAALVVLKNAIGAGDRDEAHSRLLGMLASPLAQENIAAAQAITALRDVSMIEALTPLLHAEDGRVRATAVHAYAGLGQSLGQDCAGEIKAALNDKLEMVRVAAVKRLPAVHADGLRLNLLAQAIEDPSPEVRRTATSMAMSLLPESAPALAEAFAEYFHHFDMQGLLASASKKLEPAEREPLLGEVIHRHLETARQKRQAAAQLKASGMIKSNVAQVLHQAMLEEVHRHVCSAVSLLAERNPSEAMYQVSGALHSQDATIRAQGLESLQCLGDNELARGIADLADHHELRLPDHARNANAVQEALAGIAHNATPWLRECIETFLGKTQGNGQPGYAV
jgi:HEAT repeat protein